MATPIQPDPVPLWLDDDGTLRVGDSRFPLDVLLREYDQGADPEAIVHAYPVLDLADVYAVIAYCLRHKAEVDTYRKRREEEAEALRREVESRQQPGRATLRAKLLARRAQQEKDHASPCG